MGLRSWVIRIRDEVIDLRRLYLSLSLEQLGTDADCGISVAGAIRLKERTYVLLHSDGDLNFNHWTSSGGKASDIKELVEYEYDDETGAIEGAKYLTEKQAKRYLPEVDTFVKRMKKIGTNEW